MRSNRSPVLALAVVAAVGLIPAMLLFLFAVAVGAGVVSGCGSDGRASIAGSRSWTEEQTANAHTITRVALSRELPQRAAVVAVATAIVESGLRNVAWGDRDSLGLFQQRPSQGWGTAAAILNPATATGAFLDRLVSIPGWHALTPGIAEQLVQQSGYPERYAPQEAAAAALVAQFSNLPPEPASEASVGLTATGLARCRDEGASDLQLPAGRGQRSMPSGFVQPTDPTARAAVNYAIQQLGKPYVWGATGPEAFDCSGLIQAAWAAAGVPISRTTLTQIRDGRPISDLSQVQPGDLLFIPGSQGTAARPRHVGLYVGTTADGEGQVIDAYDSGQGVIVEKLSSWFPKIVAIRRVTFTTAAAPAGDTR